MPRSAAPRLVGTRLDWLVVGGGVHGTHVAHVLAASGRAGRLAVLDPHAAPLAVWDARAAAVGMDVMRSSAVHHLGVGPYDLRRFAATDEGRPVARFERPYSRPGLALFRAHADAVVREACLDRRWLRATATALAPEAGGWRVETDCGAVHARRVVLAPGPPPPHWPAWAAAMQAAGADVAHLFEAGFCRDARPGDRVAVVGGGISAAQAALALARDAPGAVTLVMRHAPRVHDLDADAGWLGPVRMGAFDAEPCPAARRAMIARARNRGSIPPGVWASVRRAAVRGRLSLVRAAVERAEVRAGLPALTADRVVLATGFEAAVPGGALVSGLAGTWGLPAAPCGFPALTPGLCWAPGLFVSGGLAELVLGPTARNIHGARQAALRLLAAA